MLVAAAEAAGSLVGVSPSGGALSSMLFAAIDPVEDVSELLSTLESSELSKEDEPVFVDIPLIVMEVIFGPCFPTSQLVLLKRT